MRCFDKPSDDVRDLNRRDQERQGKLAELQSLVTEGLESGISPRTKVDIRRLSRETAAPKA